MWEDRTMLKIDRGAFLALALGMNLGACYSSSPPPQQPMGNGAARTMVGPTAETAYAPHNECVGWTPAGECTDWQAAAPHDECTGWTPTGECNQWAPVNECVGWTPTGECNQWEPRHE